MNIASIQICQSTTCTFFTNENCVDDFTGSSATISCEGPGDVPSYESDGVLKLPPLEAPGAFWIS